MMKRFAGPILGLALGSLAAAASSASTVTIEALAMPNSAEVTVQLNGTEIDDRGFDAGWFDVRDTSSMARFIAWCIEVSEVIAREATYQTDVALLDETRENLISRLFTGYNDETTSDLGAAAFQLAMWEIVEETPGNDLNVLDGIFVAASTLDGVVEEANRFLAGLLNFDANYRISYFQSGNSQDIITATPVPLPATLLLLGAGVGALTFAGRRRKQKSADA